MLYTPEMSRRARGGELWAALKYLGKEGVDELVFGLHLKAVQIARELKAEKFRILNDVVFNQVIVCCDNDEITEHTMGYVHDSGECWVGGAVSDGKKIIRISICSWATTEKDISRSVRAFIEARKKAVHSMFKFLGCSGIHQIPAFSKCLILFYINTCMVDIAIK